MSRETRKQLDENTKAIKDLTDTLKQQGAALGSVQSAQSNVNEKVLMGEESQRQSRENWDVLDKTKAKYDAMFKTYEARAKTAVNIVRNLGLAISTNTELNEKNASMMTRGIAASIRGFQKFADSYVKMRLPGTNMEEKREGFQKTLEHYSKTKKEMGIIARIGNRFSQAWQFAKMAGVGLLVPIAALMALAGVVSLVFQQGDSPLYQAFLNAGLWEQIGAYAGSIGLIAIGLGSTFALISASVGSLVLLLTTEMAPALAAIVAVVGAIASYFALAAFFTVGLPVALGIAAVFLVAFLYNQRDLVLSIGQGLWKGFLKKLDDAKMRVLKFAIGLLDNPVMKAIMRVMGIDVPTMPSGYGGGSTNNIEITVYGGGGSPAATGAAVGRAMDSVLQTSTRRQGGFSTSRSSMS